MQHHALEGEAPQVDVATAAAAGEVMVRLLADTFLQRVSVDRKIVVAEIGEPVDGVAPAIDPRAARGRADHEVDLAAGQVQVLGDLAAGLARADDEHGPGRELVRMTIG